MDGKAVSDKQEDHSVSTISYFSLSNANTRITISFSRFVSNLSLPVPQRCGYHSCALQALTEMLLRLSRPCLFLLVLIQLQHLDQLHPIYHFLPHVNAQGHILPSKTQATNFYVSPFIIFAIRVLSC